MKTPHHYWLALLLPLLLLACSTDKSDTEPAARSAVENRGSGTGNWWDALPRPEWAAFEKIPTAQDWFDVYRIRDHIYAVHEPGQVEEVISFLIVGTERALLFDTGLGIGDIKSLVDELTDKPLLVLNSHSHYDHIGGINLEIIDTPGHAPDCISLVDHDNRMLFTGDAFYLAPLYAHLEGSDMQDYRASAAKMAALSERVDTLVTSHNVPTASNDYLPAMDRAFEAIVTGSADYTLSDGAREYKFDGFSVLTSDPP